MGLHRAAFDEVCAQHGVNTAKAAQIKAALELGYRMKQESIEQGSIHSPDTQVIKLKDILQGKSPDVVLKNRDILYVNKRPFHFAEKALDSAIFTFVQTVTSEAVDLGY